jgi:hypothetical protein
MLLVLIIATIFSPSLIGQEKSSYPLRLEITSYQTTTRGYQGSGETKTDIGSGVSISSGRTVVPIRATTNTGILDTPNGKIRCVLWNKKHYLFIDHYYARQTSGDELEVQVTAKKGKHETWKFKIIAASKID